MNPFYQFDDDDKTKPVWRVKHKEARMRDARMPFFRQTAYVRAATRAEAVQKIKSFFPNHDRITASKA